MENCACPPSAAIPDIPEDSCPENFGQIYKFLVGRQKNQIAADTTEALLQATYELLLAATDITKIQLTPELEGFVFPQGEAIKEGGDDNSTPLGRALVVGASTIQVEGMVRNVSSATIKALRGLGCYKLDIVLINEFGQIILNKNEDDTLRGFPIHAWYEGDKGAEGKNTQDKAKIVFGLDAGWRDNAVIVSPTDWDPRFDLSNESDS